MDTDAVHASQATQRRVNKPEMAGAVDRAHGVSAKELQPVLQKIQSKAF
jgi:hypothetical protein